MNGMKAVDCFDRDSQHSVLFRDATRRGFARVYGEVHDSVKADSKNVELLQDILATRVAQMIAAQEGMTATEAIRKLMATETYGLLLDPESYLHFESAEYILYMYDAERRGDWDRWLKI